MIHVLVLALALCVLLLSPASSEVQPSGQQVVGAAQWRGIVNGSAVITTGNTFQQVLPLVTGSLTPARQALTIENNNTNGDNCWVFIGGNQIIAGTTTVSTSITVNGNTIAAGHASILLSQGGSYVRYWPYVPSEAIYITCATTSDSIYVDSQ